MSVEPVGIPAMRITRVAWSPFKHRRWYVEVDLGDGSTAAGWARWATEAHRMAIDWLWNPPRLAATGEDE